MEQLIEIASQKLAQNAEFAPTGTLNASGYENTIINTLALFKSESSLARSEYNTLSLFESENIFARDILTLGKRGTLSHHSSGINSRVLDNGVFYPSANPIKIDQLAYRMGDEDAVGWAAGASVEFGPEEQSSDNQTNENTREVVISFLKIRMIFTLKV